MVNYVRLFSCLLILLIIFPTIIPRRTNKGLPQQSGGVNARSFGIGGGPLYSRTFTFQGDAMNAPSPLETRAQAPGAATTPASIALRNPTSLDLTPWTQEKTSPHFSITEPCPVAIPTGGAACGSNPTGGTLSRWTCGCIDSCLPSNTIYTHCVSIA